MMPTSLTEHLLEMHTISLTAMSVLPTGFGIDGTKGELADGRLVAIKSNLSSPSDEFVREGNMLQRLAREGWPVPEIIAADEHCLVMSWLASDGSSLTAEAEFQTGQKLAALHHIPVSQFGYEVTTPIGRLPQSNGFCRSWVAFFKTQRLLFMADMARETGHLSQQLLERLHRFAEKLDDLIDEPEAASLLHGDIWGGNVIVADGQLSGFIDPAIYYGHREIELAFTQMFSTFGADFFKGYQTVSPLDPDFFKHRIEIYNLYPTLVHVVLFGGSYIPPIERVLSKYGA